MQGEKTELLDNMHGAPLTSIDKALALTPLINRCRKSGNTDALLDEFQSELNKSELLFNDTEHFSQKSQARLSFLIANLVAIQGEGLDSASSVLESVLEISKSMSSSSTDFTSAIPMENGWWGFEASAVVVIAVAHNKFLHSHKEKIIQQAFEAINDVSTALFEMDEEGSMRSKNAISRVVATLLTDVLATEPQSEGDLSECFRVFRELISDLRALFELAKNAN